MINNTIYDYYDDPSKGKVIYHPFLTESNPDAPKVPLKEEDNQPPVADAGPDQNVVVNRPIHFNGISSSDPEGDILSYIWDFGDGSSTSWQSNSDSSHSYHTSGDYTVTLTVCDGEFTDTDTCTVHVTSEEEEVLSFINSPIAVGAAATGTLATIGAVALILARWNENIKLSLLSLFALPLYTRIHGKETLDNFTRGQIFGHIESKPGMHFNEIKRKLKIGNGNLAYHLKKLEEEGYIVSKRKKRYRYFYPAGAEVPDEDGIILNKTQQSILDFAEQHPHFSQGEIMETLNESQQTISYNVNILVREGYLKEEKIDGVKRYMIEDEDT
jgi:DNA-binding MarR family transcriptional regulator